MANWSQIINNSRKFIVSISVIYDGKLESYGTGTIINKKGTVLTAGHVVDLVKDFDREEIRKTQILVSGEGINNSLYRPLFSSPTLNMKPPETKIVLDVALIVPVNSIELPDQIELEISPYTIKIGDHVVMAGYSEETPFPFDFDRAIGKMVPQQHENEFNTFLGTIKPATWKHGMVAHTAILDIGSMVAGQIIHVDNGMHKGSSGGAIFNTDGKVIAFITDRAMISAKVLVEEEIHEFHVPSGNTFGLSLSAVKGICTEMGCIEEIVPGT